MNKDTEISKRVKKREISGKKKKWEERIKKNTENTR